VMADSKAEILCKVLASDDTKLAWYRNGEEIKDSDKYKIVREKDQTKLIILNLSPETDAGDYVMKAENPAGKLQCTASLNIQDAKPLVPAPTFDQPLQIVFKENTARFESLLNAPDDVVISWSRDGKELSDSDKYSITKNGKGQYVLEVRDLDAATDAGDYLFTAKTPGGELKCTATLEIEAPAPLPDAPKFREPLQIAFLENTAKFECYLNQAEDVVVQWFRNGEEITSSGKYTLESGADGLCRLTVNDLDPATDAGDYLFNAKNKGGALKCTATLDIEAPAELPPSPAFSQPLTITFVDNTARLECQLNLPDVTVEWSREGQVLSTSEKYSIVAGDAGLHSLTVLNLDPSTDAGDYLFTAKNRGGTIKCTASLDIKGAAALPPGPKFKTPLQISFEETSAKFECQLMSSEGVTAEWSRAGKTLIHSDKYSVEESNGVYSLTVLDLDPASDGGDYLFVAKTAGGTLKCTATLQIQEDSEEEESEEEESEEESEEEESEEEESEEEEED